MDGPTVAWLRARAQSLQKVLCGSAVIWEAGQYFNRFLWATPAGDVLHYDKRHLFRMANEHDHYQAGQRRLVVELAGWRICLAVCYDLRFRCGCVIKTTTTSYWWWLIGRCAAVAWQTLLRARAIENQAYCG